MTGHAKVFIQHVARKNIRRHQFLDGIAVLDDGVFDQVVAAFFLGIAQPHVQRHHAPLDIQVADDDLLVVFLDQRGANCFSSASNSSAKRARGKATLEYSSVSAMRPTRSWCFTSKYFAGLARAWFPWAAGKNP